MAPRIESVEYVSPYALRVRFADGVVGDVDLSSELWGEVFEPLRDPEVFRRFHLSRELNTVTWSTGADLAPEFLYEKARTPRGESADPPPSGQGSRAR